MYLHKGCAPTIIAVIGVVRHPRAQRVAAVQTLSKYQLVDYIRAEYIFSGACTYAQYALKAPAL